MKQNKGLSQNAIDFERLAQGDLKAYLKTHRKPVTRREFLATGLLQFTAAMTLPSLYNILSRSGLAQAQELVCAQAGLSDLPPVITFNLAGGAAMSSNFVPMDQGRQPLSSYGLIGLGSSRNLQFDAEFANQAPFAAISGMLAGIRETSSPTTRANTVFVGKCLRSQDDTAENKLSMDALVNKAGVRGSILPNLGRNRNDSAFLVPPSPLEVRSYADITGALGVAGSLGSLSRQEQGKLFEMTQRLSRRQAESLHSSSGGRQLAHLFECAVQDNVRLVATEDPGTNPLSDQAFSGVWNINENSRRSSRDFVFGSIVYNVLKGNGGVGNLNIGGYDYHGNPRATTDARDVTAGQVIGQILESFAVMNKKAFLMVTSDGGVGSQNSEVAGNNFTSDRGTGGVIYMIAYDPMGRVRASDFQLGHFTEGQAADRDFVTAGTVERGIAGVFANYLSFAGQLGRFESVLPRILGPGDLDQVVKIFA